MAKIDEILGQPASVLAAMSDEQLKEYLKDVISLEPLARPAIMGVEVKVGKKRKAKSMEDIDTDDDCPIKKPKSKKPKGLDLILQMKKELEELGIETDEKDEDEND
jgi:hypothetical protein